MGCDWYDFCAFSTSGNAIAVLLKDVKKVHKSGLSDDTDEDSMDDFESDDDTTDKNLTDELESDEVAWLLDQAKGFKVFNLGSSLLLFMKEHEKIIESRGLGVPGPYGIDEEHMCVDMNIEKAQEGDNFNVLFELARKLTPQGKKLSFAPGRYSFSMTLSYLMPVRELKGAQTPAPPTESDASDAPIPLDFDIVVGEGDNQKTIKANKVVLATFLPKFESLLEDVDKTNTLLLPDLDHDAVGTVLDAFTSRKPCEIPRWGDKREAIEKVGERFGVDPYSKKKAKMDDMDHPAFTNPRGSEVTFIVGPTNEEIKANRVVLASLNPVLCRILYGTGSIPVDPSQPIRWPDFDALAVKQVLLAMVQLGKEEVVVPIESVASAKALVDYLIETPSELNLYYETPFAREFENGAKFKYVVDDDDNEGLEFTW